MPALFTRMSTLPKLSIADLKIDWPPSRVETSAPLATALPPSAMISSTTCCAMGEAPPAVPSREPPKSLTTTDAPSLANSLA